MPIPLLGCLEKHQRDQRTKEFSSATSLPIPNKWSGKYKVASPSTQTIRSLLFGHQIADVILMYINFQGLAEITKTFSSSRTIQLGISKLDLRDLKLQLQEGKCGNPSIISNKSYTTGTIQRCGEVLGSFRFGI